MSLTDVMDDVDYERQNFNENEALAQHPLWLTESHYVYHLDRCPDGHLAFTRDFDGEPLCSPRRLSELVMQHVVVKPCRIKKLMGYEVPSDLYPALLTEAIFQRSLQTVSHLVSTWPSPALHVRSVLPPEDLGRCQQLTTPFDAAHPGGMSLCDAFMMGLLNLKPHARLKLINFAGFKQDRKLCRELARLPILWMKPGDRQPGYIHSLLRHNMGVSKDKVQRYVNKITCIYANIDLHVRHGHTIGPITIIFDCKVTLDDVPIGLALQSETPFRFACQRVWTEPITDVSVPLTVIHRILNPRYISHLEIEDPDICKDLGRWDSLLETLLLLPALRALSLPNTVHVNLHANALYELNQTLRGLRQLRRVNLASCNLRDCLDQLLLDLDQGIDYLSLRDCRLGKVDVQALLQWPKVSELHELNLSRNNLQTLALLVAALLHKMAGSIVCFSVSFTSLSAIAVQQVVRKCKECQALKILAAQSFTPPPLAELRGLLEDLADIPTLQRCILLPEAYAFPGSQISQRALNRETVEAMCTDILVQLGRPDIELE
ncbi:leucine-rich repeat-containing protein 14-like [Babylonia areolata]|uniref:leucine-rich repeat-containing protein 14-like n=1 Tax=Babylonia areolata TaxID=304850 RepID=UPI003FD68E0A